MEENRTTPAGAPGKAEGITSLVLGILSLCFCLTGAWMALILGIVGLVFAGLAKKDGYRTGIRTGGFVTSLLGVIFSCLGVILGIVAGGFVVAFTTGLLREILSQIVV